MILKSTQLKSILLIIFLSLITGSCEDPLEIFQKKNKYYPGDLPDTVTNLENFNSEYDDFNPSAPYWGGVFAFCFSTKKYLKYGDTDRDFDIAYEPMLVKFDFNTGILTVTVSYDGWGSRSSDYELIRQGLVKINTQGDELGPNLVMRYRGSDIYFTLMYASDETGDFQINYITNKIDRSFSDPVPVTFLNSEFDDLYPCFNPDTTRIYFCSNRENGNFDIYYTSVDYTLDPETILSDSAIHTIQKDTVISSDFDDKCPFLFGNVLIFTSNRPGGYGGYDLYYCRAEGENWSEPVNFGSVINSEADDYRPILLFDEVSNSETMMIFSSNREGGLGGFDLYFVGVDNDLIY